MLKDTNLAVVGLVVRDNKCLFLTRKKKTTQLVSTLWKASFG
jgi:hypothetical protein